MARMGRPPKKKTRGEIPAEKCVVAKCRHCTRFNCHTHQCALGRSVKASSNARLCFVPMKPEYGELLLYRKERSYNDLAGTDTASTKSTTANSRKVRLLKAEKRAGCRLRHLSPLVIQRNGCQFCYYARMFDGTETSDSVGDLKRLFCTLDTCPYADVFKGHWSYDAWESEERDRTIWINELEGYLAN